MRNVDDYIMSRTITCILFHYYSASHCIWAFGQAISSWVIEPNLLQNIILDKLNLVWVKRIYLWASTYSFFNFRRPILSIKINYELIRDSGAGCILDHNYCFSTILLRILVWNSAFTLLWRVHWLRKAVSLKLYGVVLFGLSIIGI